MASKEQCDCTGSRGREALVDMERDREGAHGGTGKWEKMNGAGEGKKERGLEIDTEQE